MHGQKGKGKTPRCVLSARFEGTGDIVKAPSVVDMAVAPLEMFAKILERDAQLVIHAGERALDFAVGAGSAVLHFVREPTA
ncbi:hypothetical protein KBB49_04305 [Candidatus Saccharibacteria bacterium]|nr:hypothetical protein [Candidatus Saccharibacteria bacterium]